MSDDGATDDQVTGRSAAGPEPDVLLDVPELSVDEIRLTVDGLDADLSLRARLANLLQLDAGVRVHLEGVELDITGVRAEALLKVRLEKLVQILDRALTTIDRNPELIDALARSVGATVDDVHRVAGQVAGPAVHRTADAGEVVDRTVPEVAGRIGQSAPAEPDAREPSGREPSAGAGGGSGSGSGGGSDSTGGGAPGGGAESTGDAESGAGTQSRGGASESAGDAGPGSEAESPQVTASDARAGSGGDRAAQLAGQAGQTLRQAGRSVWEAIQSGMSQQRQQRPRR
ncbi:hypothetical protein O7598_28850 [Micromonospora sp. WMMC241]|uniref:hypothetical protein n=1 Tax=Micromonospora sp. WMMC241 TaxID=3015159 RepID=UPI0022B67FB8|nr:hypothetical protein [Micromonospora sp. WMMC241]MCZ7440432.1 hypothetical protein [Micromonospora sp. WMMC241]